MNMNYLHIFINARKCTVFLRFTQRQTEFYSNAKR